MTTSYASLYQMSHLESWEPITKKSDMLWKVFARFSKSGQSCQHILPTNNQWKYNCIWISWINIKVICGLHYSLFLLFLEKNKKLRPVRSFVNTHRQFNNVLQYTGHMWLKLAISNTVKYLRWTGEKKKDERWKRSLVGAGNGEFCA